MNKSLLTMFCATTLLLSGANVFAADEHMPPRPGHEMSNPGEHRGGPKFDKGMHKKMAEKFAKDLDLTEEQKVQSKKLREESRKKMEPLFKQMGELRKKMDKIREENMKDFEKILTPEQKTKLEKMKAERESLRKDRKNDKKMKNREGREHHKAKDADDKK